MIPKIIHQIWIQGYDKIPLELLTYHQNCIRINGDFKYYFWDNTKIRNFLLEYFGKNYLDLYDDYTIFAQKADFARYAILYILGGIYLDMDMLCKKDLSIFLNYNFFLTPYVDYLKKKKFLNGIIGSRPKHPVFINIFTNIFKRKDSKKSVTYTTGTKLLFDSIMEYIEKNPNNDVSLINTKHLHPCSVFNFNNENCKNECVDCYVVHTDYSSWSPGLRFAKYLIKYRFLIMIIVIICIIVIYYKFVRG